MAEVDISKALRAFAKAANKDLETGHASERSFYPALETLLEACGDGIDAQIETAGRRDIVDITVKRRANYVGAVEVKEPSVDLARVETEAAKQADNHNAKQFNAYLAQYDNLLYTNLIEWRRYRAHDPAPVQTAVLGTVTDGKLHLNAAGVAAFESLVAGFLACHPEPQTTARGLALEMARLTRILRDQTAAAYEADDEFLAGLFNAFQEELIHGLEPAEFADMYAQTIAYGLFTARILHADDGGRAEFDRFTAGRLLPRTNPFLRRVFGALVGEDNLPPSLAWIVDDLVELIKAADIAAIQAELARFGASRGVKGAVVEHDPVIYFYEHFLRAYDPAKAKKRGVYYTPLPVVSYIVRSIDILLQRDFGKPLGLADPEVIILDPACGTGTFLYEVIRLIHERLASRSQADWVNKDVPTLLGRLFGFELLMAPYTIAHLKLAQVLQETGYTFTADQRLNVFLTNTLEGVEKKAQQEGLFDLKAAIAKEKKAADDVKEVMPVMVVLGNPPYAGHSANASWEIISGKKRRNFIGDLLNEYYFVDGAPLGEKNPKWLQDDYVKFLRWAQWRINKTGAGVVGMITNHGYLDNPTFRGMRQNLMATFDDLYLLDLHGNAKKKEKTLDGGKDENVFDIMQGVGIALFSKREQNVGLKTVGLSPLSKGGVQHADLYGLRAAKYAALAAGDAATTAWEVVAPRAPFYLFTPGDETLREEYEKGLPINAIIPVNGVGMTTARDDCVIEWPDQVKELIKRVEYFRDSKESNEGVCLYLNIPQKKGWNITRARELARSIRKPSDFIVPVLYRPFDIRSIFYHDSLVWRTVKLIMRHMLAGPNLGVTWTRPMSPNYEFSVLISGIIIDQCAVGNKSAGAGISYLGPLYLYGGEGEMGGGERRPNLAPSFVEKFLAAVGASELVNSPTVGLRAPAGATGRSPLHPEDIFYYIYGVLHAPLYRSRYAEFLKMDFPRVPLPKDYATFDALALAGEKLARLHLLKDKEKWDWGEIGQRGGAADATVGKVEYDEASQEVIFDATKPPAEQLRVGPVPKAIWEFHVGGYQVLQKWLKDRKGRKVELGDYVPIILALAETDRIMREECDPAFKALLGL